MFSTNGKQHNLNLILCVFRLLRCGPGSSRPLSSCLSCRLLKLRVKCSPQWFSSAGSSSCHLMSAVFLDFAGRCNNVQAADIVFLVDGSSSIGQANFLQVKGFMEGLIKPFASSVSATGIRFGAIQYSDTSRWLAGLALSSICPPRAAASHVNGRFLPFRVEFTFSAYLNGTQLVNAVQNLNYKGGNTRTGAGLKYVADNLFNSASRRDVPKVCRSTISSPLKVLTSQERKH